jgi:hypothetical protein
MKKVIFKILLLLLVFTSCDSGYEELNVDQSSK